MSKPQPSADMETPAECAVYAADLAGDLLQDATLTKLALDGLAASLKDNEPSEAEIEAVQHAAVTTIACARILAKVLEDNLALLRRLNA